VVDIAAIPGVTAPSGGATPVTAITATAQYTGTVSWAPAHDPFQGETAYTATITLTAKEGFTFTGVAANFFTVSDATTVTNAADSGEVTAVFPESAAPVGDIVFEDGTISIGIAGEGTHMTGQFQLLGASMAAGGINALADKVDIDGMPHEIALVPIETGEATVDPTGSQGYSALLAKIDLVDFILGGFRTEALTVYREVAVGPEGAGVIFIVCGAAPEALQHSVVDDYDNYKYWFKTQPPNEYILADAVVRIVDSVGRAIRASGAMAEDYTLRAGIIADDLVWCDELVTVLEGLLLGVNIDLVTDVVLIDPLLVDPGLMGAALTPIAAGDPHIVIPILSADAGVAFAGTRKVMMPSAMSVGINVPAQFKSPWAADLATAPPGGPYVAYDVHLDTWAEEVAITSSTLPFLAGFMSLTGGEYPLYTASTYDALLNLAEAIEAEAWYDEDAGVGYANTDDIIAWLENPANARTTTTGSSATYPQPGTTSGGEPALSEAQVSALYPHIGTAGYPAYNAADWTMPPHTTHDLVTGPGGYMTGLGCQWQWDSDAGQWKKFAVWPMEMPGVDLKDQYGDWNFEYTGTNDLILNPAAVKP